MGDGVRRCEWPDGCTTILRESNKTGLCGAHEKKLAESKMQGRESSATREEVGDNAHRRRALGFAPLVEKVYKATASFYGASTERNGQETSFAQEVAIYLLKEDSSVGLEVISINLKCDYNAVVRSYHKIQSMAGKNAELRCNLDLIRKNL